MERSSREGASASGTKPDGCVGTSLLTSDEGMAALDRMVEQLASEAEAEPRTAASPLPTLLREQIASGGKRIRARLALATADALGGERANAVGWAGACEILHNASLIHDDIQDGDTTRRGKPALWCTHGMATALSAGDWLLMLPYRCVDRVPATDGLKYRLTQAIATAASTTVHGQAAELALRIDGSREAEQAYYRCVEGKTAALFELPVRGAALIAGRAVEEAEEIGVAFRRFGVLFQLQDDVLDLYGDKGRGQAGNDIREGKVTSLVVEHLRRRPEEAAWLRSVLQAPREETREADVRAAIARFRVSGALRRTVERIDEIARTVIQSPTLARHPQLHAVATGVVRLGLRPIDHVVRGIRAAH